MKRFAPKKRTKRQIAMDAFIRETLCRDEPIEAVEAQWAKLVEASRRT